MIANAKGTTTRRPPRSRRGAPGYRSDEKTYNAGRCHRYSEYDHSPSVTSTGVVKCLLIARFGVQTTMRRMYPNATRSRSERMSYVSCEMYTRAKKKSNTTKPAASTAGQRGKRFDTPA